MGNLPDKGANEISSINFTIDDLDVPKIEARKKAIEKASNKALLMAEAAGVKLGRIINISEGSNYAPVAYTNYNKQMSVRGADESSPIQVGSNEITVNVTLTYEIK